MKIFTKGTSERKKISVKRKTAKAKKKKERSK